jgi:hypothetical protein
MQHFVIAGIILERCGPIGLVAPARRTVKRRSLGMPYEDTMTLKLSAAVNSAAIRRALLLAAVTAVAFSVGSARAESLKYDKRGRVTYGSSGPNASYQAGPRTRVYISKRSWLDAGTEVLPGERKFTDYAFPPALGYPSFGRENLNRPLDRAPLSSPADLGGYPQAFPLY